MAVVADELLDNSWLAGLLEGEGSFGFWAQAHRNGKAYGRLNVALAMTDRDVVERAASRMDCNVNGPYTVTNSTKPFWRASATGQTTANVIERVLPFLGERRTAAATKAVEDWRSYAPEPLPSIECVQCRAPFTPARSDSRFCQKSCSNTYYRSDAWLS